jgi:hypothetical protein
MIYFPASFALLYVLPLLSIGFFYACVVTELYCRSNDIEQSVEQRRGRNRENREVAVMLITVVVLFAVSWAPMNTLGFLQLYKWRREGTKFRPCYALIFQFIAEILFHSNAAQNAFIYFTFNKRFKNGLKKLFPAKCKHGDIRSPEITNGTTLFVERSRVNGRSPPMDKGEEGQHLTTAV